MIIYLVIAILLLVGSAQSATLTVCPSGCEYSSIQKAIDAASPGDIIVLFGGTYLERIKINKSLTLLGINEDDKIPMIDAGKKGTAIILSANGITLKGVFAKNSVLADISTYSGSDSTIDLNERSRDSRSLEEFVRAETETAIVDVANMTLPENMTSESTPQGYQEWGGERVNFLAGNGCSITPFGLGIWKFDEVYDNPKDMHYQGDMFTYSHRGEKIRIFIASEEFAKELGYTG